MNIGEFIMWFTTEFIKIGTNMLSKLDNIYITNNVSLLDFTITIAIIGAFINIIITVPTLNVIERRVNIKDRQARRESYKKKG